MYCVKVGVGKERARVRDYHSGFLPSYKPAFLYPSDSHLNWKPRLNDRGVKRFIVPGYVFLFQYAARSTLVAENEWKVIEAISDIHLSTLDPDTEQIVEGPLKEVNHLITQVDGDCIQISVDLLGVQRQYWLRVSLTSSAITERTTEIAIEKDRTMKQKTEYSQEQIAAMLERAEKIGIHAAANEYGIAWQTLTRMKQKAESGDLSAGTKKDIKKPKQKSSNAQSKKKASDVEKSKSELLVENAMLKERITKLEEKIKTFQKATKDLIED